MDPVERGRRIKAAVGYGFIERKPAAEALGVSLSGLNRVYRGKTEVDDRALERLARLARLPFPFFTIDFATGADTDADLARRLRRVEARLVVVEAEVAEHQRSDREDPASGGQAQ